MGDRELRTAAVGVNRVLDRLRNAIEELDDGQDEPHRDDAAIEQELVALWATSGRLRQYALLAARLDQALEERSLWRAATDPEQTRALRQDVQVHARQKHRDLLARLAVAVQGQLALDLVRRSNAELVKGLTTAFADASATLEAVDAYRSAALRSLRATADALTHEIGMLRDDLERSSPAAGEELALPAGLPPVGVLPASLSGGD